jgi:hypothetical protein
VGEKDTEEDLERKRIALEKALIELTERADFIACGK